MTTIVLQSILKEPSHAKRLMSGIEYALRKASKCESSCGPKVSFGLKKKLFSHVGAAALPLMRDEYVWEKSLEDLLPERNPPIVGPTGISANPSAATIVGTIYVEFDTDFMFGRNPTAKMTQVATDISNSVNGTLGTNQYRGVPINSNITVIPVPPGNRAPNGAHVFKIGGGANDEKLTHLDKTNGNRAVSWAEKRGKKGYLYNTGASGHEVLHWLGLSDRYTEVVVISGSSRTSSQIPIFATWGRNRGNRVIALANVQPEEEGDKYDPANNAMSSLGGVPLLTDFQLEIVFSNSKSEKDYDRDVVAVGPYVEGSLGQELAVEFKGHEAKWWHIEPGNPAGNRPKNPNEYVRPPSTFRYTPPAVFFGQNFHAIRLAAYDTDHNWDHDNLKERIQDNRREIRQAIQHQ